MILRWYVAYIGIFIQQSLHFRKQTKTEIKINKYIIIILKIIKIIIMIIIIIIITITIKLKQI